VIKVKVTPRGAGVFIRCTVATCLLFGVWKNSHWSVALAITYLFISVFAIDELVPKMSRKGHDHGGMVDPD